MRITNKAPVTADAVSLEWLVRLRFFAAAGFVVIFALCRAWLALPVETVPVACVLVATVLSNVILARFGGSIAFVLVLDVVLLTVLLNFSGGAANPFSVLYVIHVAIAARAASARMTVVVWLLSTLGFGSLFAFDPHLGHGDHTSHYLGMWVAYSLAAALTGYFVARLTAALARLQRASQAAQRLATMSTMAGSAAHELGTPLGTIAVVAESLGERVISDAVERCRVIIRGMNSAPIEDSDAVSETRLSEIVDAACAGLVVERQVEDETVVLPRRALVRTVRDLVTNAIAAGRVKISARVVSERCTMMIEDDGAGMSREVLDRLGEPYFTTKPTGSGLGVYLAATFVEALGGALDVESEVGKGTRVRLDLPRRLR